MRKAIFALIALLILIFLMQPVVQVLVAKANPAPYDSSGGSNVEVSIISPQNRTYDSNDVDLVANFGAFPGVWYISYSLDDGSYVEIAPGHPLLHNLTETVALSQLPNGTHSVEVRATAMANDEDGTVVACSKVYFAVTKTLEPLESSSPTPTVPELSWLMILPLLLSVFSVAVILRYRKTANSNKTATS